LAARTHAKAYRYDYASPSVRRNAKGDYTPSKKIGICAAYRHPLAEV